jgi:Ca2+/H+ antiporter
VKHSINWLLAFIPITLVLEHVAVPAPWVFFSAALAIVPIAALIVRSTEQLATYTGDAVGGPLNATFGNAPELIIAMVALRAGLLDMVRASLVGAILANLLLALGVAFLLGGLRFHTQTYQAGAARLYSSMMLIAAISLAVPSAFSRFFAPGETVRDEALLNIGLAVVLLAAYVLYLVFMLKTHPDEFAGEAGGEEAHHGAPWSLARDRRPRHRLASRGMDERDPGRRGRGHRHRARNVAGLHRHRVPRDRRRRRRVELRDRDGAQEQDGPHHGHRARELHPDRALRRAGAGARELLRCAAAARALVQPSGDRSALHGRPDRRAGGGGRSVELVQGRPAHRRVSHHRADVLLRPDGRVSGHATQT